MRWALRNWLADEERQALIKFVGFEGFLEILMDSGHIPDNTDIRIASSMVQLEIKMSMADRYKM